MKRKLQQLNRLILVFAHLALFTYPTVSKLVHTHEQPSSVSCSSCCSGHQATFAKQAKPCSICDFEFFNYIAETQFTPDVFRHVYPVLTPQVPEPVHTETVLHASLRAPPVA